MSGCLLLLKTAWRSLRYRQSAVLMTLLSIAISIFVLLGVEHLRKESRDHFTSTVSGVDLIVGARTGQINLLLYSVFRIGAPTNNIGWDSVIMLEAHKDVAWLIPISLGDSHRGFRVVGTDDRFFEHFRYGQKQALEFSEGKPFEQTLDAVLGAQVAAKLNYKPGAKLVLAHGIAEHSFSEHSQHPFTVTGILEPTGTPVDNAIYVDLSGIEAMHQNWQRGVVLPHLNRAASAQSLEPKSVTAVMLGLNSKLSTFKVQRWINDHEDEALMAILPGVVLVELWQMTGAIERVLLMISALIFVSALFGVAAMLLSSMRERRQELRVLRSLGASPLILYLLLASEAVIILVLGATIAIAALLGGLCLVNQYFTVQLGLSLSLNILTPTSLIALGSMLASVLLISLLPAWRAYRESRV
jgi:putative ABC transport system permease protein